MNNRGEVRVALGVNNGGRTVALGAWSGKSWEDIGADLNRSRGRRAKAGLLISDGEAGLAEGLSGLANGHQRCHWHMVRDLNHTLWDDDSPKSERDAYGKQLRGILGIELPADCVEPVREHDRKLIRERIKEAERQLDKLAGEFFGKGYVKAAGYVNRARDNLFSSLRFWLKCGIIGPRASSMIERMMREIGRRLKRIAFGWSEQGAAKMARIVIKRFSNAKQWEAYWLKKLRIDGKVILVYKGAYVK
jgi:transposase-like protein